MFFRVDIDFFDEILEQDSIEHILISGRNNVEVVRRIDDIYGDEAVINKLSIEPIAPDDYVIFSDKYLYDFENMIEDITREVIW